MYIVNKHSYNCCICCVILFLKYYHGVKKQAIKFECKTIYLFFTKFEKCNFLNPSHFSIYVQYKGIGILYYSDNSTFIIDMDIYTMLISMTMKLTQHVLPETALGGYNIWKLIFRNYTFINFFSYLTSYFIQNHFSCIQKIFFMFLKNISYD